MKNIFIFIFVIFGITKISAQTIGNLIQLSKTDTLIHNEKSIKKLERFFKNSSKKHQIRFTTKKAEIYFSKANQVVIFISRSNERYIVGNISWTTKYYPEASDEDECFFVFDVMTMRLFKIFLHSHLFLEGRDKRNKEYFRFNYNFKGVITQVYYEYHFKKHKIIYEKEYKWDTITLERESKLIQKLTDVKMDSFFKSVDDKFSEMKKDKKKPMPISFDY